MSATPRLGWITCWPDTSLTRSAGFLTPDWAGHPTEVPYANFGNPQSLNLYRYAQNNPTTFRDPDGHCPPCPVEEETGLIIPEEEAIGTAAGTGTATATAEGATAAGTTAAEEVAEAGGGRSLLGFLGRAFGVVGGVLSNPLPLNPSEQKWIDQQKKLQAQRQREQAAADAEAAHRTRKSKSTRDDHQRGTGRDKRARDLDHPSRKHGAPRKRADGWKGPWPPKPPKPPEPPKPPAPPPDDDKNKKG